MSFRIRGAARPLVGEATVPGDKSIGHRALLLAALGTGRSTIRGLSGGEDNRRTRAALAALGVTIYEGNQMVIVDGAGLRLPRAPVGPLDCGNSGTTMRLLAGALAAQPFAATLSGDRYLSARPMARVARPLEAMGARVTGVPGPSGGLLPPLTIGPAPGALAGIAVDSPTPSAQVKSAILLAALSAEGPSSVLEPARSRDHTERMLAALGAPIAVDGLRVALDPTGWDRRLAARDWVVPGDLSSAAFLLAAAAVVPGSVVTVRGVGVNPTRTGFLDVLLAMGAALRVDDAGAEAGEPIADITAWGSPLRATTIGGELAVRAIDELPLVAAVAAHAAGTTVIRDAAELRVKESDRIAAMAAALGALGVVVRERPDGLEVEGGRLRGGTVASRGDHRIAMAAAVAALAADGPTTVEDTANVATSFPGFATALGRLGAELAETEDPRACG